MYVGITGVLKGQNAIVAVVSMALGGALGTMIDVDKRINKLGDFVAKKVKRDDGQMSVADGFVTACLLFCVGAMAIVGSLNSGLGVEGGLQMIYTKSVLDFISAIVLSASLGIGVIFSSVFVLVFQGGIVLLAGVIAPVLTANVIAEITCVGSLMIIGLALNIVGATKIKIANYLPALVIVPIVVWVMSLI
jgi:uncharacterized membrane protein YqgA involved in biofilm formation